MLDIDPSMLQSQLLVESWNMGLDDYIMELAWSPDGSKLAAATVEGAVFLLKDRGNKINCSLIGQHSGGANALSWRCDGAEIATAGHDGVAKIWDGDSGKLLHSLEAGSTWVSKVAYSPRRHVLATAAGPHLRLWNDRRETIYESSDHDSTISDLGWNPQGPGIAAVANQRLTVHLSDASTQPRKYAWQGSSLALAWSPDSKCIATGEQDASVHFWSVDSGKSSQMRGFPTKVRELSWDVSGRWLATGSGPTFLLCDCSGDGPAGKKPRQCRAHQNNITQLAFQPYGELLASADADGFLLIWEPIRHTNVIGGVMLGSPASCVRWSKSSRLAVGQQDGKIVTFGLQPVSTHG